MTAAPSLLERPAMAPLDAPQVQPDEPAPIAERGLALRRITDEELTELRAGRMPLAEAARWVERARSLNAPSAPLTGALDGTTGWVLGHGSLEARLRPGIRISPMGTGLSAGATFATISFLQPETLRWAVYGSGAALAFGISLASRYVARRRIRSLAGRPLARDCRPLFEQQPGEPVCIEGVVAAGATFPSPFRGQPCVLARSALGLADEMRGVDFVVNLDDGARVHIEARGGYLTDPPTTLEVPPACGPVYADRLYDEGPARILSALHGPPPQAWLRRRIKPRETAVGPGDRVMVLGVLHREVAPDGVAAPGRATPMRLALRSSAEVPLSVRRLGD